MGTPGDVAHAVSFLASEGAGVHHRPALGRALARSGLHGDERAAGDQLCQGGGDQRPASRSVCTYCFMVNATSAMPQVTQPGVREHFVSAAATPL